MGKIKFASILLFCFGFINSALAYDFGFPCSRPPSSRPIGKITGDDIVIDPSCTGEIKSRLENVCEVKYAADCMSGEVKGFASNVCTVSSLNCIVPIDPNFCQDPYVLKIIKVDGRKLEICSVDKKNLNNVWVPCATNFKKEECLSYWKDRFRKHDCDVTGEICQDTMGLDEGSADTEGIAHQVVTARTCSLMTAKCAATDANSSSKCSYGRRLTSLTDKFSLCTTYQKSTSGSGDHLYPGSAK